MTLKTLKALKSEEKDARRKMILDAARHIFAAKDFRSVTVRQIAKTAEVSVGTIYNYYKNLDELFLDIFLEQALTITRLLDQEIPQASLTDVCVFYVDYLNRNISFYQMMSHFMIGGNMTPESTGLLNEIMRSLVDRLEAVVRGAGYVENTRLSAHALFSALNGIMISYAHYPGRTSEEVHRHTTRLARQMAQIFVAGKD